MQHSISRVALCCGLLALGVAAGGCRRGSGPTWNLAPVKGTVTQAGRPLDGIEVTFWPDAESGTQGPRSSSFTDAAGQYELRTDVSERGAVIGRYRVCLVDARDPAHKLFGDPTQKAAKPKESLEKMKQTQVKAS